MQYNIANDSFDAMKKLGQSNFNQY